MRILLVVYDNDSYTHYFPSGLAYIASVLQREGLEVEVWSQDFHHYPDSHLTEYLDRENFDLVAVSVIGGYYQYRKLLSLSAAINKSKNRPIYLLGGHGPSPDPEYFLKKMQADIAVIGEGEETIVEVVRAIAEKTGFADIKGIAYREDDTVTINDRRDLITNLDDIAFPAYELFPMHYYRLLRLPHCKSSDFILPMLSGRGCTFKCNFCYRLDKGFRPRSTEGIVEEIKLLQRNYAINYLTFMDELMMSSVQRVEEICQSFLKARLNIRWNCQGRLNFAKPDLLRLMKEAGCVYINYGIEAVDDQILKNMNKVLTVKQIIKGIEATLAVGISPGFNVIFGNIGETKAVLQKGVDFLLKYDNAGELRTIRPVTPYPGSPLFDYAVARGLLRDVEDFYENKHVNSDLLSVNFTDMTDDEVHLALCEANKTLLRNYYKTKLNGMIGETENLYHNRNAEFRGYRHS